MIKILELIDGGFIGGGQTHIISLVNCLDKSKFEPIISASGKGEFRKLVEVSKFNFEHAELPKFYRKKHLTQIDEIVKKHSIDIIHSHGGVAGMYARFYKKNFGCVKTIHTIHGIHYINSSNILRKYFSLSIEQYLVQFTDRFICVSESDRKLAEKLKIIDPKKTSVIHNGINLERFNITEKNSTLMTKYGFSESDIIVGNISRFDYQKNQRYILKNCREILNMHPDLKIILAGNGKYLDDCKKSASELNIKDKIFFPGEVKETEEYFSLFDIFIFPSLWEGLSISMIEAMADGKCIIASDIPSNKELIEDGVSGYLFDLNNVISFKNKIEKLIINKELRNKFSENASMRSKEFSEKAMTEKTESEYFKIVQN